MTIPDINPYVILVISPIASPELLSVLGGQLLINLKDAGERGLNGGTNYIPECLSDIGFASRKCSLLSFRSSYIPLLIEFRTGNSEPPLRDELDMETRA